MQIIEDFSLQKLNSFGLDVRADRYCEVARPEDLSKLFGTDQGTHLILGGGSNILFTQNFQGLVIRNSLLGIDTIDESDNHVWVKVQAGENWHGLVTYCLQHGYGGLENLSLIPGSVGAAPMQNIGAYGVEIKDVFHSLEAVRLKDGVVEVFDRDACLFGYRESVFKGPLKGQYFISTVTLKLSKKDHHISSDYGAINDVLTQRGIENPTITDISKAVISIRQSKLPDPVVIGNAGSFFKNPVIDAIDYEHLKIEFSTIPGYKSGSHIKVPAGWLIEQCGWKGYQKGSIGVHKDQALVLVNYGGGSGKDIFNLSLEIQDSVATKFGIELTREVNVV